MSCICSRLADQLRVKIRPINWTGLLFWRQLAGGVQESLDWEERIQLRETGFWRGWNQRRWSTAMKDLAETKEILNLGNGWHVINSLTCVDICNLFSTSVDGLWLLSSGFNKECLYLKQLEVMEWFHSASIYGVVQVVLCSFCFLCCSHSEFHSFFCLWALLGIVCLRGILTFKLCESWSEYDYLK